MPEYTYLLETRLSAAQQNALAQVREAARGAGMTVFLAGGAVRDLTTGSSVRDLDFAIQGNALQLEKAIVARGGSLWGRHDASRTLFFWFPGSVRVEVSSTRAEKFPRPGKPVYTWSGMVDDLHRRDFTANAMALSLNDGSYGLLLDPLNGVADIEARHLRLVSNYGFLEDPSRLVRAVRLTRRLGWSMEERTALRYENAKETANFDAISPYLRGYELEELAAEEDALTAMKALEAEGWMGKLLPAWTSASVDTSALNDLHHNRIQLLLQGIAPDLTAAHLEVLTAKMAGAGRQELKRLMVRPGLRTQWEGLEAASKEFSKLLTGKETATPSATWKLLHSHAAEPVLWLAHTRKPSTVEAKLKNFFTVWPEAAKKVPVAMMLEMRITPELPAYDELLRELFLQQIDGKLETDEQMRAFLEPYSPPAPPPPVTLRRTRGKKADGKSKRKGAARDADDDEDERPAARDEDEDEDAEETEKDTDDDEAVIPAALGAGKKLDLDKVDLAAVLGRIEEDEEDKSEPEDEEGDSGKDELPLPGPQAVKAAPAKATVKAAGKPAAKAAAGSPAVLGKTVAVHAAPRSKEPQAKRDGKAAARPPVPPSAASQPAAKKPAGARSSADAKPVAIAKPNVKAAAKAPAPTGKKAVLGKSGKSAAVKSGAKAAAKPAPKPAAKKAAAVPVKKAAPARKAAPKKQALPAKAAKKAAPAAAKSTRAAAPPARRQAAKPAPKKAKSAPKPAKKVTAKVKKSAKRR